MFLLGSVTVSLVSFEWGAVQRFSIFHLSLGSQFCASLFSNDRMKNGK